MIKACSDKTWHKTAGTSQLAFVLRIMQKMMLGGGPLGLLNGRGNTTQFIILIMMLNGKQYFNIRLIH